MLDCDIYRTAHGVYKVPNRDMFINNSFKRGIHWEDNIIRFFKALFSNMRNKDMISVGSHVGTTCIPLARYFKKVYAFEAQSEIIKILLDNIEINKADNVLCHHTVISNSDQLYVTMADKDAQGNSLSSDGEINYGGVSIGLGGEVVQNMILDTFCFYNNTNPSFISIDAEGSEQSVILSVKKTILECKPIIMVEMNYVTQTKEMCESLCKEETLDINDFLTSNGYRDPIDLGDYNFLYIPIVSNTLEGYSYIDMYGDKYKFTDISVGTNQYYHVDETNIIVIFGDYLQHGMLVEDKIMWNNGTSWTLV